MRIFLFILILTIEYLKYFIGLKLFFNENIKRIGPFFVGTLIYIVIIMNIQTPDYKIMVIMFMVTIITLFLSIKSKIRYRMIHILISIFIITCLDGITEKPIYYILENYKSAIITSNLKYLICSCISLSIVTIAFLLKQNNIFNYNKTINFIRKWIYFFIALMGIFLLITVAELDVVNENMSDKKVSAFMTFVSTASQVSIIIIGISMVYIKKINEKMEKLIASERKLKDIYVQYYKTQLEREEDTRRYRHDLSKHLVCLAELANNKNNEIINAYIKKMQGQIFCIQEKSFFVGNEILDAILNYYLPMLKEDIEIDISGKCNKQLNIDPVDLCTVFSNLIQNSVEELNKEGEKKFLRLIIQCGNEYFSIEIRNSISMEKKNIIKNFFDTKKKDKRNHGFGLQNIKELIEKNKGLFEIKREENEVVAKAVFKNKITA